MSFSAWEILELAIPQCEELDEPELLGERILKAKILLSLPRHASRNDQVPVICINLDRDEHRYLGVSTLFQEKGCILDRHPGVYGASIPSVARDAVFRRNMPTNAVGCCLSHIGVWEKVAKTDKSHLVIEDDGLPSFDFSFEEVMKLLPVDFDVCFVNDRAYESWFDTANPKLGLAPLARSFEQLDPDIPAIGADGYILSPKGAAILLDMIRETGIIGNLDWQLYSLGLMGLEFDESRRAGALVAGLSSIMEERHKLNAYVSTIPLVSHTPMGFTARYHFS
jgi:GR25 family glycosyltransferase involved in LPS biosynthesis